MRLIDADAYEYEMSKVYGDDWDKLHILESMPTVEQKHGHFIQNEFVSTLGICSVCEHPIEDGDNYCKWCGAKLRGDNDGN